jgi:hypothetical protein
MLQVRVVLEPRQRPVVELVECDHLAGCELVLEELVERVDLDQPDHLLRIGAGVQAHDQPARRMAAEDVRARDVGRAEERVQLGDGITRGAGHGHRVAAAELVGAQRGAYILRPWPIPNSPAKSPRAKGAPPSPSGACAGAAADATLSHSAPQAKIAEHLENHR